VIREKARELAEKAVGSLWGAGVFGVEMFLLEDGRLPFGAKLVLTWGAQGNFSSISSPPGRITRATTPSKHEAHLRVILDLPLPAHSTSLATPSTHAIMLNLLGASHKTVAGKALEVKGATVHLHGKGEAKKAREMGHITVVAGSMAEAENQIQPLINAADADKMSLAEQAKASFATAYSYPPKAPSSTNPIISIIMDSDSDLPVMKAGAETQEVRS